MIILGIETSCDDTAAAVLERPALLRANIIASQDIVHERFGGVVPELASRRHLEAIIPVVDAALNHASISLQDIDLIAVTQGPGLVGSLLVGFSYAKSLSYALKKPFVGVDHMAGHLLSAFLEPIPPTFPYIALIVSGGTSSLFKVDGYTRFTLLGRTRDDAVGEVFDKIARHLQLGYPGGPVIGRYAEQGDQKSAAFPRAWLEEDSLDFSFSGLKTAILNHCNHHKAHGNTLNVSDLCAAFQHAVVEVLVEKTMRAAARHGIDSIVLGGGVAANTALRRAMHERCIKENKKIFLPGPATCTDNAAMIALAGLKSFEQNGGGAPKDDVFSRSRLGS